MAKVTMPQLGESVAEGTIGKWLKQPGDTVAKYEPLLEVITDKVNAEVPSPVAGVLKEILVQEGETVPNNAEIAVIETSDEADGTAPAPDATVTPAANGGPADSPKAEEPAPAPATAPAPEPEPAPAVAAAPAPTPEPAHGPAGSDERPERAAASAGPAPTAVGTDEPGNADARMTPAVRRLLREHGLTAAQIVGTGGGGRITREDVTNYVETQRTGQAVGGQSIAGAATAAATAAPATPASSPAAPAAPAAAAPSAPAPATRSAAPTGASITFPAGTDEVLVPMTQMRKGIATQMTKAL
ncbi:MAG TPA: biotin/lipoyl-containing protein, partial [Candidatus Limnocylindrales bacterium]|nr:biotin/lipoyl-containing protein [Candidatus Limnocylindrales bacterium]